jgi:hypothetical protein
MESMNRRSFFKVMGFGAAMVLLEKRVDALSDIFDKNIVHNNTQSIDMEISNNGEYWRFPIIETMSFEERSSSGVIEVKSSNIKNSLLLAPCILLDTRGGWNLPYPCKLTVGEYLIAILHHEMEF